MEWSKAKTVLLVVLICTNLFLVGNLIYQVSYGRSQQKQAMDQALLLLKEDVGEFDDGMLRELGGQRPVYAVSRQPQKEAEVAQALLGTSRSDLGSGASRFLSEKGVLTFGTRGEIELHLREKGPAHFSTEGCREFLEQAGIPMKHCAVKEKGGEIVFLWQTPSGQPVPECTLTCSLSSGALQVKGRWLLDSSLQKVGEGSKSYQMVVALRRALVQEGIAQPPERAEKAYRLKEQGNGNYLLWPVWQVKAGGKIITVEAAENRGE